MVCQLRLHFSLCFWSVKLSPDAWETRRWCMSCVCACEAEISFPNIKHLYHSCFHCIKGLLYIIMQTFKWQKTKMTSVTQNTSMIWRICKNVLLIHKQKIISQVFYYDTKTVCNSQLTSLSFAFILITDGPWADEQSFSTGKLVGYRTQSTTRASFPCLIITRHNRVRLSASVWVLSTSVSNVILVGPRVVSHAHLPSDRRMPTF